MCFFEIKDTEKGAFSDDFFVTEKIEGIVISKYLDKYDLVKIIEN